MAPNLTDQADSELRAAALLNLTERLKEGGKVAGCDLRDLTESYLIGDHSNWRVVVEDIHELLVVSRDFLGEKRDLLVEKLIERHLLNHPEEVDEEAANIEALRAEDEAVDLAIAEAP